MNAPSNIVALKSTDQLDLAPSTTSASLILSGDAMERIFKFAEMMAKGTATVPRHLQGNSSDCLAVVMQATQWGMNPFAVAQKTHVSQGGALGYEAQLISAVITANAPVTGQPEYEYIGDWNKVLGKVEERKSDKGGKYYVATYTKADEAGLGVICRMTLKGESGPREMTVMMSQCFPRFSTQWATDPKQQISYVAIRKWSRLYAPGVILGVYEPEELEAAAPPRQMGPVEEVQPTIPEALLGAAQTAADKGVAAYQTFWKDCTKENRKLLAGEHERLKGVAIETDRARTVETPASKPDATNTTTGEVTVTFDQMIAKLDKAANEDALYVAMDWSSAMDDQTRMGEVEAHFNKRLAAIKGE